MTDPFVKSITLRNFLSFGPDSPPIDLRPLNVLIGPNGSGKSNLIEAFELLRATSGNLAAIVRGGGGPTEWLWKGSGRPESAGIEAVVGPAPAGQLIRYKLAFAPTGLRFEIKDEALEDLMANENGDIGFHFRASGGMLNIVALMRGNGLLASQFPPHRQLTQSQVPSDQSVFSQRKDPDLYPELTWAGERFGAIEIYRDWAFGRHAPLRQPQPTDLAEDVLLPNAENLALVLSQIEHKSRKQLDAFLGRFFGDYERLSFRISGGTVQLYFHEGGLNSPIPAARLSDGTIRFLALLAILLAPTPPSLICIDEPELGLHPDAVALVAELLELASKRTQLVVTTHSDALVSALSDPEDVLVVNKIGDSTAMKRVDPKELKSWLDQYRLGDIWRMGELGGNP